MTRRIPPADPIHQSPMNSQYVSQARYPVAQSPVIPAKVETRATASAIPIASTASRTVRGLEFLNVFL